VLRVSSSNRPAEMVAIHLATGRFQRRSLVILYQIHNINSTQSFRTEARRTALASIPSLSCLHLHDTSKRPTSAKNLSLKRKALHRLWHAITQY